MSYALHQLNFMLNVLDVLAQLLALSTTLLCVCSRKDCITAFVKC